MPPLGDMLRERRQEHQWTLDQVAQQTRIRQDFLQALEEGEYDRLPADVQVRGFLRTYAQALGLDAKETVDLYQEERGLPDLVSIAPLSHPPRARSCALPSLGFAILATVIVAAIAIVIDRGWLNPATIPPTASPPIPTPTRILPTATPTAQVITSPPTHGPTPAPSAGTYEGIEAILEVSAACWVRVISDDIEIFQGTLAANTTRTFNATRELNIRMGNAGGVRVILNGEDLGVQGGAGQVVTRIWTVEE